MGVCENDTTAVALCSLGTWTLCWNDRKNLHEVWSLRLKTEPGNSSSLCSTIIKSCVFILQPHFYKMGAPALPFSHSSASELSGERVDNCVTVLWLMPWQPVVDRNTKHYWNGEWLLTLLDGKLLGSTICGWDLQPN